jgi:hypothetical protein
VLLLAAWRWGPDLWDRVRGEPPNGDAEVASPELAEAAWARYEALARRGEGEIRLSGVELESILRFQLIERLPPGVSDPSIRIREGEVVLGLRVAAERIPAIPELESVRGILPDTVPVQLRGRLLTLAGGEVVLLVHRIDASAVPIPRRFFPRILEGLARGERTALPPEALPIPLPDEVGRVRVEGDFLVLSPPS